MGYSKLKGTYDIIPLESDFYLRISRTVEKILENYGYKNIAFPVIEYADLFARGAGDSSDIVVKKEMYVFEDRGKRIIALRPEGTASAVRLYIENGLSMQGYSARMYYNGPMFRAENPQAGRYRQFVQYGAEYIGDGRPEADVELISMNNDFFNALGIKDVTIFVNSIGCRVCRPAYQEDLRNYFKDKLQEMCKNCRERYQTNVLRILDCKDESCADIIARAPSALGSLCPECLEHWDGVRTGLDAAGIGYKIDERLVRGLDYYSRTVFEIKSSLPGAQGTISAGGRYDYLVKELGGPDTPAAGFAFGMERLASVLEEASGKAKKDYYSPPLVYIAFIGEENRAHAVKIIAKLRSLGLPAVTEYRYSSLKKHLKSADSMKAGYALFAGSDEVSSGSYALRDLSSGEQISGSLEKIIVELGIKSGASDE
jgi:histidyl-tRNA synthetase